MKEKTIELVECGNCDYLTNVEMTEEIIQFHKCGMCGTNNKYKLKIFKHGILNKFFDVLQEPQFTQVLSLIKDKK